MDTTPRQTDVLQAVEELTARLGYAPTISELAKETGLSVTRTYHHLNRLEEMRLIAKDAGTARSIRVIDKEPQRGCKSLQTRREQQSL